MGSNRSRKVWTADLILEDWLKALKKGLGRKRLDPTIETKFSPLLLAKIQSRLDPPKPRDYNVEGRHTREVAKALGEICKVMSPGANSTVTLAIFESAFKLCKLHPSCPGGGGGGGMWCDI